MLIDRNVLKIQGNRSAGMSFTFILTALSFSKDPEEMDIHRLGGNLGVFTFPVGKSTLTICL